jgi:N-sulfoglucosamine sulfohydrolase
VCDLLGIAPPAWLQGQSLLPVMRGEIEREAVFSEINFHVAYDPQRAVRTKRWKYIRRFDGRTRPTLPNCDDSPSKSLWMEHGWRERPVAAEQLYDLLFDPNEACNLASDPAYSAVLGELRAQLEAWMKDTGDPLLEGPLERPEGFPFLDPDQTSPSEIKW